LEKIVTAIYIPCGSAEHWAQFLAEPTKQWKRGCSARTFAYCWHSAIGFPSEISATLATSEALTGAQLLLAIPEHKVRLPGARRGESQNDLWVLTKADAGLISMTIEGKVAEPLGETLGEWLVNASPGKLERLAYLRKELGLADVLQPSIRYQLLHRTASAILEAKRFNACHAVMLVHTFSQTDQWFDDFATFVPLFDKRAEVGKVVCVGERGGVALHLGWGCGGIPPF
jgi:hypothetical protein